MKKYLFLIAIFTIFIISFGARDPHIQTTSGHLTASCVAIHPFDLKEGVNAEEFEKYMLTELIPIYNKVNGQEAVLLMGDRGIRSGKYAVMMTFDDQAKRNEIYPPAGGISEEFRKVSEGTGHIWDKLDLYVEGELWANHTDYNRVNLEK